MFARVIFWLVALTRSRLPLLPAKMVGVWDNYAMVRTFEYAMIIIFISYLFKSHSRSY